MMSHKNIMLLSNIFEWYDFTIYSFLAAPIGMVFFNSDSSDEAVIYSYALFAISYFIRPLGALFFSYLADRQHVSLSLRYTMLLLAIPSVLIGFLPEYKQIGFFAPILLIVLRCIQGFASGGELPSLLSFIFESTPESKYKNLICAMTNMGGMLGMVMASFVVFITYNIFSQDQLLWAWRIPFILSIPLAIVILRTRYSNILKINNKEEKNKEPILIKLKSCIKMIAIISFLQVSFYIIFVWMGIYLENNLQLNHSFTKGISVFTLTALFFLTIASALLSSKINSHKLIFICVTAFTILSVPLFILINTKNYSLIYLALLIFIILASLIQGNFMYLLASEFRDHHKNKYIALIYTIPTAIFGGTAGMICNHFVLIKKWQYFPGYYLSVFGFLLFCLFLYYDLHKEGLYKEEN